MATMKDIGISDTDRATLQFLSNLLHLFQHRNKNQHRRSIWWRHFSTFRHQLRTLVAELTSLNDDTAKTHLARTQKKSKDVATRQRVMQRVAFWKDVAVAKWQYAFSQLVADGRFAVLGLVLLAALAQTCQIVGVTSELEAMGQAEVEKVLEAFGREDWGLDATSAARKDGGEEDQGEVVQRQELITETIAKVVSREDQRLSQSASHEKQDAEHVEKRKKPKRRKGNAIDDLFSGLG